MIKFLKEIKISPTGIPQNDEQLADFLNNNLEEVKAHPDLEEEFDQLDGEEFKFEYINISEEHNDEAAEWENAVYIVNNDGEPLLGMTFNVRAQETDDAFGGADTPITINGFQFYYGHFNG